MDLVSVVIPVFNAEKYIRDTIDSVLEQSYNNIELVICNDGSTDASESIINERIKSNKSSKKIRLIKQKNKGLSSARNTAISTSNGDYIALLDADDLYHPDFIRFTLRHLKEKKGDFAFSNSANFLKKADINDKMTAVIQTDVEKQIKSNFLLAILRTHFLIPMSAYIAKRELFEKVRFDENISHCEDIDFHTQAILSGYKKAVFVNTILMYRRTLKASHSKNLPKMLDGWLIVHRKVLSHKNSKLDEIECYSHAYRQAVKRLYKNALYQESLDMYKKLLSVKAYYKIQVSLHWRALNSLLRK